MQCRKVEELMSRESSHTDLNGYLNSISEEEKQELFDGMFSLFHETDKRKEVARNENNSSCQK